ncbi:MAG: diacylglycerol kinase family protein, partial [Caldilineaceae bacterium]|nr:diacylglycerol kinase family protein [Caldilineaceae bacterium]
MRSQHSAKKVNPGQLSRKQLTGRDRGFWAGRWFSLHAAAAGVFHTIRTQPNAWIELTAVSSVTFVGILFGITRLEWIALVLIFSVIVALEAVNTAIEAAIDLVSPQYHPLAKIAKDAAAGALLITV